MRAGGIGGAAPPRSVPKTGHHGVAGARCSRLRPGSAHPRQQGQPQQLCTTGSARTSAFRRGCVKTQSHSLGAHRSRGSVRARANGPVWPARAPLVGIGTSGGGAWDGLRVLRLGGGDGAAGAHRPGLSQVPLPGLRPAVQRAQWRPAEPDAVPFRRHRPRGAVAAALPADPARPLRDVPPARHRVQMGWTAPNGIGVPRCGRQNPQHGSRPR